MPNRKLTIFLCLMVAGGAELLASGPGTTGAQILNLNTSARSSAMGHAMGAVAGDANAIVYNPAALHSIKGSHAQLSHLLYYLDSKMSALSYGHGLDTADIGMGFKLKLFSSEDVERDSLGENIGEFDIRFMHFSLGAGMAVTERLAAGAAVKVISEDYNLQRPVKASALACDLGLWLKGLGGDSFGFVIKNLGPKIEVGLDEVDLDRKVALAGAHDMETYLFAWEVFTSRQHSIGFQAGMEVDIFDSLRLRGGGSYVDSFDFSLGFGIPWQSAPYTILHLGTHHPTIWELDYAFYPHMDMGKAHRVSLGASF